MTQTLSPQTMGTTRIGGKTISRLIIGGNPFSGFSHQNPAADDRMRHYYSAARIKEEFRRAEALGVTTHIGRADNHITRVLMEYWDEGGKIQWIAQSCPELGPTMQAIGNGLRGGAVATFIHGGRMDWLYANNQLDEAVQAMGEIRQRGLAAGVAGHKPQIFDWAAENLDADFFMCSYYNPTDRSQQAAHQSGAVETFHPDDRDAMVARIAKLPRPVIHYKVLAAGRTDPKAAFDFVARHLRPQDAVCIGIFSGDKPDMLAEDVRLLRESLRAVGKDL
jgi:hypothetical protein